MLCRNKLKVPFYLPGFCFSFVYGFFIIIYYLKQWLNRQDKRKGCGTFLGQLFQRSQLMNRNKFPLEQSAVGVWTWGDSFLQYQNSYSQIHGKHVEKLALCSLYFPPVLPSNTYNCFLEISLERGHILWVKKERWEGEKMFVLCLNLLAFQAFPADSFHSTGTFFTVYSCPLTWFYQSHSKDAHHLGLQE